MSEVQKNEKIVAMFLVFVLSFSMCACTSEKSETVTVQDKVRSAVEARLITYISLSYDTVGVHSITCYIDEVGENKFEVSGKVTVKDKYGDTYSGKYDAVVDYNPSTDECSVDYDLDKLYKN